ncbi:MAG TPA: SAM-dependent chlorinase/fluorinase [Rhodospirillales bacterium]|nr:SAM-dependent chlorinase/fluorinase [Rhodospirillales bacterium]
MIEFAPEEPIFDLFSDVPSQNPKTAAYLLAAYAGTFPKGSIFVV